MTDIISIIDPGYFRAVKKRRYHEFENICKQKGSFFLHDYYLLKSFLLTLNKKGLKPMRQQWENVYNGGCEKGEESANCFTCSGC